MKCSVHPSKEAVTNVPYLGSVCELTHIKKIKIEATAQ